MRGVVSLMVVVGVAGAGRAQEVKYVGADEFTGGSAAAVVGNVPLAHTGQIMPISTDGSVMARGNAGGQVTGVFAWLQVILGAAGTTPDKVVKLNVYAISPEVVAEVKKALPKQFPAGRVPPVTFVVGKLPHPEALVALDAVATAPDRKRATPLVQLGSQPCVPGKTHAAVLPPGRRVYIAGQAEKGDTPADATLKTLAGLRATLKWLGLDDSHVVQCKAFLKPMTDADAVTKAFGRHFGIDAKLPPLVLVEWDSSLPIEIELIAAVPPGGKQDAPVEFLTPPGMKESPIYSRVTRVQSESFIYTGGLVSPKAGTGEEQVRGVFDRLTGLLKDTGGDLKHLVKATYYVSDEDASTALNKLRPNYYDPKRPPSASKAKVPGVGFKDRSLVLDMIAVPAPR